MKASMSCRGNCHDNACAESFWGRLKVECLYRTESIDEISGNISVVFPGIA